MCMQKKSWIQKSCYCLHSISNTCARLYVSESVVCVVIGTCVTWHAVVLMCGAKTNHVESVCCHACHAVEANGQDSYTVSADRQTDLGTAVYAYVCEYSICSTWESIYICLHWWKRFEKWRRTETAMSWAGHMCTSQSVKDVPLLLFKFTWCGSHSSNQEPSEPHIRL